MQLLLKKKSKPNSTLCFLKLALPKINVIKAVREITGLGLKEAKDVVDNAPKAIKEKVAKEEADTVKAKLDRSWR